MLDLQLQTLRLASERLVKPSRFNATTWFDRLAVAALGMTVLTLGLLALDDRLLAGEPVWLKPLKFSVSFALLFATLSWATRQLSQHWQTSWLVVAGALASAAAFAFEMAYIGAQAARQEASHFNNSSPFHAAMYGLMGAGATALMLTIGVVGLAALMDREARLDTGLRLGIVLGFFLSTVLTFWVAGELVSNGGRYIGQPAAGAATLPLLGWSMTVGDLRPAHFLALHAMQVIPAMGYLASRFALPRSLVWITAALYASFTIMVFLMALKGIPLISA
ncbi:hypothetical protein [Dinoroseobacter sp. S76]|uniref:hypothetical protein n=1 Tax=Dinoroseobacter sp. S76 TaxID=3415124 RepID=UPI003C7DFBAF